MSAHTAPRRRLVVGGAAALVVLFAVTLRLQPGSAFAMRAIDDIGQSVAALLGAAGCLWRMRRSTGRGRLSWALTGAALACWGAGELVWSYYELIARRETPFPSVADLGYLLFPALALPGLLVRPSAALAGRGWFRVVLDGAMVAASLFNLSWATSLGTVYHSGGQGAFAFGVSLAYPASDLVMLTVAISVLAHARQRTGLPLLVLGLGAMAVADSGFSYLTALGNYRTGSIVDVAWFAAFLLIGVSAVLSEAEDEVVATRVESPVFVTLPYVLLLVGFVAEGIAFADNHAAPITLFVQAGAVAALLLRQLLTVLDNRRLALDVVSQQAELRFRAFHDALTGLANRALFYDRVAHALELHRRDERPVAVLFCDLDDFKSINDALGHQAGDAVLTAVGERLGRLMRSGDTVARLGGDEFAVLLEDDIDLEALAGRVLHALAEPVEVNGRKVSVRASVGTAVVQPDDVRTGSQELLKRADLAMYAAKRAGKGTSVSFTANLGVRAAADLDERLALADDIRAGRVHAAFQPIVRMDGRPFAFEALARWNFQGAEVPPTRFIPLADRAGLLGDLDLLVTRHALQHAATSPAHRAMVSVNIGLTHLQQTDLPERLAAMLAEADIERERLVIEIPETQAVEDPRVMDVLAQLRALGFSIAVDDFGIGYSNLARLGTLAPDIIKLDKSLVDPLGETAAAARLVSGMIDLAHDLGALVIAEGVETNRQLDALRGLDCDAVQGFLIGRPVVPAALAAAAARLDEIAVA